MEGNPEPMTNTVKEQYLLTLKDRLTFNKRIKYEDTKLRAAVCKTAPTQYVDNQQNLLRVNNRKLLFSSLFHNLSN